ncbi:MAG: DUF115 domain-containing protein [Spirochaetaceae bacterium]|jgi:hypothetical protein|nr:DUF115 domain-containing protein [Spirochaetaceae bacterium]
MDKQRYFDQNLLDLSDRDPALCTRLSRAKAEGNRYLFLESRSGEIVPAWVDPKGGSHPLHSLVDPVREGDRVIGAAGDEGFLIFFGLGGGFSVTAALEREEVQHVLVIDYDLRGVVELLGSKSYRRLFTDPRFHILVDPSAETIERYILDQYQPVVSGGIRVIPLRIRVDFGQAQFGEAGSAVNGAIAKISGDYSVQAYFGTRWFSNILRNLIRAEEQDGPIPTIRRAAISAAGPSLDIQLPQLAQKRRDLFLIATDTSLPSLLHAGIEPDAVVSIDCQHISYYHFMAGLPDHIPLYLDLASPPLVASRSRHPRFFGGGHPFTQYISRHWRPLPLVDTSGGNVTYAALSLADMLGAEHVELYGADFSYPLGRTYSRGTYIYPYFEVRQHRLSTLESLFSAFLFRSPVLNRVDRGDAWYYETPTLTQYRALLEEKTASLRTAVIPVKGMGAVLKVRPNRADNPNTIWLFAPGSSSMSAEDFLSDYREKIRGLPAMQGRAWSYRRTLNRQDNLIFTTLLPASAAIKRRNPRLHNEELFEAVRNYCVKEIDKLL